MTRVLWFFQIKTVRSAWVFLLGSVLLMLWGAYIGLSGLREAPDHPEIGLEIIFFGVWFAVTGIYISIASWALFSEKGRIYLSEQEKIPIKGNRSFGWFLKFLFGCYAAAFASIMLFGVLALPFIGFRGFDVMFSQDFLLYALPVGIAWSPIIYRYLK